MRKEARAVLEDCDADLAVVGLVKQSGEALSLWFVPAYGGEGSLGRGDRPYELDNATLGQDFRDDFRSELATVALVAVAPLARTEVRGRVLEKGLRDATGKLATLLRTAEATLPRKRRAHLQLSLGNALATLGERESGTELLGQSIAAYRAALENNLALALQRLGEPVPEP